MSGGGDAGRPRLTIDHVQLAVEDLDAAAERLQKRYGLVALAGGRHPWGTANRIVPLGSEYLELIAVVEPALAAERPMAQRVARAVAEKRSFPVWAVRTHDLDASRAHLLAAGWELPEPQAGSRVRPDGVLLEWRSQELVADAAPSPLPFLIEWRVPAGAHPGEMPVEHPSRARRIKSLTLSDPEPQRAAARLDVLLARDVEHSLVRGPGGVSEVVVGTDMGDLVLR